MPLNTSPFQSGLSGILLGLTAGLAPGPMFALVISQALRYRAREGMKVALAPLLTDPPIIFLAVLLSIHVAGIKPVLAGLSLIGAGYLAYLGYETIQVNEGVFQNTGQAPRSLFRGILTNLLNPHPYLFWFTVGAPLPSPQGDRPLLSAGMFLGGFYLCLVGAKMVLAGVVGSGRLLAQGRIYTWTMRVLGCALMFFALSLAVQAGKLLNILS